jgi:hypothetical protein
MEIIEQVPSYKVCISLAEKGINLNSALVWVSWDPKSLPQIITREEYNLSDDVFYLSDAPTETEMKKAILEKKYFQDVWLKSSIGVDGLCYESLEYENDFGIHQIAIGKASTSTEAIAQILEEVMSQP